jgi:hypothetical protein
VSAGSALAGPIRIMADGQLENWPPGSALRSVAARTAPSLGRIAVAACDVVVPHAGSRPDGLCGGFAASPKTPAGVTFERSAKPP